MDTIRIYALSLEMPTAFTNARRALTESQLGKYRPVEKTEGTAAILQQWSKSRERKVKRFSNNAIISKGQKALKDYNLQGLLPFLFYQVLP
jgi:hypothetical protein